MLRARLAVGGLARRVGSALAGVERVIECLAIVALIDRGAGLVERRDRRGVLGGGVFVGARGARRFDGRLRLIDLLLRRFGAAHDGQQQTSDREQSAHDSKV